MKRISHFFRIACPAALMTLVAVTGRAQTAAAPSNPPQTVALEEIVVTAQKREERVQDVPISIAALTATAVQSLGITDTTDLSQAIPGLQMYPINTSISPYIRGIGNRNTSVGDEAAVALYVDGVYIADMAAGVFSLNNIDRIEVLKGPQGTLFGRNAAAGVIQVVTRTPQQTPSVDFDIGYGNYDTIESRFYGTTGITQNIAADLAVYEMNQADGWGHNLHTGSYVFLGHELSARTKWLATFDNTTVTLTFDYDRTEPVVPPAYTDSLGGKYLGGTTFTGFYNTDSTVPVSGDTRQWGTSLQIHHDLDWARFVSISSYRGVQSEFSLDNDAIPAVHQQAFFTQPQTTWTQELQLLAPSANTVQWIAGAFYYHDDSQFDPLHLQIGIPSGIENVSVVSELPSHSYAGFGQATAPILADTNLTAGLRYTVDDRAIIGAESLTPPGRNTITPIHGNQSAQFDKLTWRLALDHHFAQDILGYVSDSRGFKSGVYNATAPSGAPVHPEVIDSYELGIKSEFLDQRLRINAATFYNKIKDLQLQVPILGSTELVNAAQAKTEGVELDVEVAPVRDLTLRGGVAYLKSEYTSFRNAAFYTPLPNGGNVQSVGNATGEDLDQAPPWTENLSADYRIPTPGGTYTLDVSGYHNAGYYFDQQDHLRQPAYSLLNASVDWQAPGGNWGVRLWGKNLNDAQYYSNITPQVFGNTPTPMAPRTYGITLHVHY
jgi:iron complex outermembrane receptor protein